MTGYVHTVDVGLDAFGPETYWGGLPRTVHEAAKTHRKLALSMHPDKNRGNGEQYGTHTQHTHPIRFVHASYAHIHTHTHTYIDLNKCKQSTSIC